MAAFTVTIVRTGTANLASVSAGFARLGANVVISQSPEDVEQATHLVLPGVGAFAAAMAELSEHGLVEPLRARFLSGRPTLAVCLGLQLLAAHSAESPGATGLGVIDAEIGAFSQQVRVPQFGWNQVEVPGDGRFLSESGYAYFANSYCLTDIPNDWNVARTDYDGPFVSAMERAGVLACQFHPELSGPWGLALLKRWLEQSPARDGKE